MHLLKNFIIWTVAVYIVSGKPRFIKEAPISKDAILKNLQDIIANNGDNFHFDMVSDDEGNVDDEDSVEKIEELKTRSEENDQDSRNEFNEDKDISQILHMKSDVSHAHTVISDAETSNPVTDKTPSSKTEVKLSIEKGDINNILAHLIASQATLKGTQVKLEKAVQKIEKQLVKIPDVNQDYPSEYDQNAAK